MDGQTEIGSQLDFETLVELYYRGLYQFGLSLTGSASEAGDLTQQTFYLWAKKGQPLCEAGKVKSWLFTTLYREFSQSHRRQFPQVEVESAEVSPKAVNQLDADTVMSSLQQVDELYRAPLALFYLEDLAYKEIAEALGVPVGTVQSRIARGKAQLATLLQTQEVTNG